MANLTGFRGDTFNLPFTLITGTPPILANLTADDYNEGAAVFFTLKEKVSDSDAQATVKKQTTAQSIKPSGITTGIGGFVSVNITSAESYDFKTGPYFYGVQVKAANGNIKTAVTDSLTSKQISLDEPQPLHKPLIFFAFGALESV